MAERNPACQRCPLGQQDTLIHRCVWGTGSGRSGIMLVAEAPGQAEDETGEPFRGPAGHRLNALLEEAGLARGDLYISNVNKCRPPGNRAPTDAEMQACFPYLATELAAVQPRVIVAAGATAIKLLTGHAAVGRARGTVLRAKPGLRLDVPILATFHPAALLHRYDPQTHQAIVQDLETAAQLAAGGGTENPDLPAHHLTVLTPERAPDALRAALAGLAQLADGPTVALDCEWTGERPREKERTLMRWPWTRGAELFSIALSVPTATDEVCSVAVATPLSPAEHEALAAFVRGRAAIFHNAQADLLWLDALALPLTLAGDSFLLADLLDKDRSHSLEAQAMVRLGMLPWKGPLWDRRPRDDDPAWRTLLEYNAHDTYATLLLDRQLRQDTHLLGDGERAGLIRLYTRIVLRATPAFVAMARHGMPLDLDRLDTALAETRQRIDAARAALAGIVGCRPEVAEQMANSPDQTVRMLRRLGVEVSSSRKEELQGIDHPAAEHVRTIRVGRKDLGSYLQPWRQMVEESVDATPRLHTLYRQTGTRTGRTSAEVQRGASIQLVKRGSSLRPLLCAPPGRTLVSLDYANIEMRIAAWIAEEPHLIELFCHGEDAHAITAAFIRARREFGMHVQDYWPRRAELIQYYQERDLNQWKLDRQAAKPVNFGFLYGMESLHFGELAWSQYGVRFTEAEAEEVRDAYMGLYSGLPAWHRRAEADVARGYVVTPLGYIRRDIPDFRKAVNCVDTETELLTGRGWLHGDELRTDDDVLTKNAATGRLEWQHPTDIKRYPDYEGPVVHFRSRSFSAVTTPEHRWLARRRRGRSGAREDVCRTSTTLAANGGEAIHRTGDYPGAATPAYDDDFVELAGWVLTDGSIPRPATPGTTRVIVFQSARAHPANVQRIDALLARRRAAGLLTVSARLAKPAQGYWTWQLSGADAAQLRTLFPGRILTVAFLRQLTAPQLRLLRDVMLLADGAADPRGRYRLTTGLGARADAFQALAVLCGQSSSQSTRTFAPQTAQFPSMGNRVGASHGIEVTLHRRTRTRVTAAQRRVVTERRGMWCPVVPNTFFVARRAGQVYITGNTPVQSTANYITMLAAARIHEATVDGTIPGHAALVAFVHDSNTVEVDTAEADTAERVARQIMEDPGLDRSFGITLPVPLAVDIHRGSSWE